MWFHAIENTLATKEEKATVLHYVISQLYNPCSWRIHIAKTEASVEASVSRYGLHGPSMFAVKAKIDGVLYNQASSVTFDETSSYWSALKSS